MTEARSTPSCLILSLLLLASAACTTPVGLPLETAQGYALSPALAERRSALTAQLDRLDRELLALETAEPRAEPARERALEVAGQLRDLARFSLTQERVVASRKFDAERQLGEFLDELYDNTAELLDAAEELLRVSSLPSLACRTEISGEPDGARIHYLPYGEFADQRSTEWRSYDFGSLLDIGLYQFRVTPEDETPYFERVLILRDPFRTRLRRVEP